jgi:hypothetical protein
MIASRKTMAALLAALTFASAIPTSPASACGWRVPCGAYGGWGWGHHYGYGWGYGGAGLAVGLAAGALAAGAIAAQTSCVSYRSVYDRWGNYAGQQAVRVC